MQLDLPSDKDEQGRISMGRDGPPPCGRCVQNAHVYGSSCDSNATAVDDTSDSETDNNSGLEKRDDLDAADTSYDELRATR